MSKDSEDSEHLTLKGRTWQLTEFAKEKDVFKVKVNGESVSARILRGPDTDRPDLVADIDGRTLIAKIILREGDEYRVQLNGRSLKFALGIGRGTNQDRDEQEVSQGPVLVSAPMSGRVVSLNISLGSRVSEGQSLAVLEAMKMQNDIAAPITGKVKEIYVQPGTLVKAGDRLCFLQ